MYREREREGGGERAVIVGDSDGLLWLHQESVKRSYMYLLAAFGTRSIDP